MTKRNNKRLITFERKVFRTIYGPNFNSEIQILYERKSNGDIKRLYTRTDILYFIRRERLDGLGMYAQRMISLLKCTNHQNK